MNPIFPRDCARKFDQLERLGVGGYGAVYLAHEKALDRRVAIKLIQTVAHPEESLARRFLEEARITASIQHPNVVTLYDFGAEAGIPWIAYEFLPGRTTRQMLEDGPLSLLEALSITIQVADALAAAHAAGILHRDIKPENVMEVESGRYKVTDFGIAKWSREGAVKTATGIVLGTTEYLAPEVIHGDPATVASDIYSVGVMLYELLMGLAPFKGANVVAILDQHLKSPPPHLPREDGRFPLALDTLLQSCLSKEAGDRPSSALELKQKLEEQYERLLQVPDAGKRPAGPRSRAAPGTRVLPGSRVGPAAVATVVSSVPERVAPRRPWGRILAAGLVLLAVLAGGHGWRASRRTQDRIQVLGNALKRGAGPAEIAILADILREPEAPALIGPERLDSWLDHLVDRLGTELEELLSPRTATTPVSGALPPRKLAERLTSLAPLVRAHTGPRDDARVGVIYITVRLRDFLRDRKDSGALAVLEERIRTWSGREPSDSMVRIVDLFHRARTGGRVEAGEIEGLIRECGEPTSEVTTWVSAAPRNLIFSMRYLIYLVKIQEIGKRDSARESGFPLLKDIDETSRNFRHHPPADVLVSLCTDLADALEAETTAKLDELRESAGLEKSSRETPEKADMRNRDLLSRKDGDRERNWPHRVRIQEEKLIPQAVLLGKAVKHVELPAQTIFDYAIAGGKLMRICYIVNEKFPSAALMEMEKVRIPEALTQRSTWVWHYLLSWWYRFAAENTAMEIVDRPLMAREDGYRYVHDARMELEKFYELDPTSETLFSSALPVDHERASQARIWFYLAIEEARLLSTIVSWPTVDGDAIKRQPRHVKHRRALIPQIKQLLKQEQIAEHVRPGLEESLAILEKFQ